MTELNDRDKKFIELYESGERIVDIARLYGVSRQFIDGILSKHNKKRKYTHCLECGRNIKALNGKMYCSSKCKSRYFRKNKNKCLYCGKLSGVRKFCNNLCKVRYDRKFKKIQRKCATCGKIFYVSDKRIKNCSPECSKKYRKQWKSNYYKNRYYKTTVKK